MQLGRGASVCGLLLFGTTTSLFAKLVYELTDNHGKHFRKPWAMTTLMFIGMSLCLPLTWWQERKKAQSSETDPLLEEAPKPEAANSELKEVMLLTIPTLFDLIATVLMNIGLLTVTASVYQMMRGAEMMFAAFFAVTFLKRRLNKYHYLGILCCISGICLVGLSSYLQGEGSQSEEVPKSRILMGMALIITSQAVQAAQVTFEDFFMADLHIAPMKIVGYEGLVGSILMLGIMLPAVHYFPGQDGDGLHEDTWDTLRMIRESRAILIILLVDMFALLAYNITGMSVTGHLGAVFRTVLETMRTLFVWIVDLLLFYTLHSLGESWSMQYSWIQLAGFVVLVMGTVVYGKGDEVAVNAEVQKLLATAGVTETQPDAEQPRDTAVMPVPTRPSPQPIVGTPASLKITMNMTSQSYKARLSESYQRARLGTPM